MPDLFVRPTPTPTEIREASVREIAEAMVVGMNAANARSAAAGAWLNAGLPEVVQDPPAVSPGSDGAA
jgi:hypothetical protein